MAKYKLVNTTFNTFVPESDKENAPLVRKKLQPGSILELTDEQAEKMVNCVELIVEAPKAAPANKAVTPAAKPAGK